MQPFTSAKQAASEQRRQAVRLPDQRRSADVTTWTCGVTDSSSILANQVRAPGCSVRKLVRQCDKCPTLGSTHATGSRSIHRGRVTVCARLIALIERRQSNFSALRPQGL